MKRFASIIEIRPEKQAEYEALHADPWPEIIAMLTKHHVRNYSIFIKDNLLFSYLEYHGDDYDQDMAELAKDPKTQQWWELTDPCQKPIASAKEGEWWSPMREVFHMD
jgi:L-rhamnose mutarotase